MQAVGEADMQMAPAAQLISTATDAGGVAVNLVALLLGSTLLAGIFTTILGNARAAVAARRDRYAQVVRTLFAWVEYPYRIRRRTDDNPATLAALDNTGHDLQERLAESRAWVTGESRVVAQVLDECLAERSAVVGPACVQAWRQPPITSPEGMVLGDFGPRGTAEIITRLEHAIAFRFGIRRLTLRRFALRRLNAPAQRVVCV
jgi:hypothetical protein